MKLNQFQELSKRTLPELNKDGVANYTIGLVAEAGEVADIIKKELFHGHEANVDEIEKELGDVLHYLSGVATMYDLTLEGIAQKNIDKLRKRYPNGFNEYDSVNRKV